MKTIQIKGQVYRIVSLIDEEGEETEVEEEAFVLCLQNLEDQKYSAIRIHRGSLKPTGLS